MHYKENGVATREDVFAAFKVREVEKF